ncbi:DNA/RNA non-specific endonuclease [Gallibacterium anatis]|uniref:DNA/RNA non-specific endonuclease n=1 Tax=Gallibacterium anatis TaxID=750 RepID=UPI000691BACE|nr:DNA/RNA non-specific endonuclease [Gallibacterium anatis]
MFEKLNQQNLDNPREIDKSLLEKNQETGKKLPAWADSSQEIDISFDELDKIGEELNQELDQLGEQIEKGTEILSDIFAIYDKVQSGELNESEAERLLEDKERNLETMFPNALDEHQKKQLEPNTTYETDTATFNTDEKGRVITVIFTPVLNDSPRTAEDKRNTAETKKNGKEDDDGGHIQAHSLGGTSDPFNLVPQNDNLNRGKYKALENKFRNALKEGKEVNVEVKLRYDDPEYPNRPSHFEVTFVIDGIPGVETFKNEKNGGKDGTTATTA